MDETKAIEILDRTLRMSDAEAVVVAIDGETQACTRFADNVITQNTRGSDITLRITCAYGQQHATATTNAISEESLKAAVERAQTAARLCPSDRREVHAHTFFSAAGCIDAGRSLRAW